MQSKRAFFKEAIKDIKTSGTIAPSSKYLIKKILKNIDFSTASIIVEFGSGNGNITKEILERLHKTSVLICFEINQQFHEHLQTLEDPRLIVLNRSVEDLEFICNKLNIKGIDYFISSLPLTNISQKTSHLILSQSHRLLKKDGYFFQYQYSLTYLRKLKEIFNEKVELDVEVRNIPPAFIYKCQKQ